MFFYINHGVVNVVMKWTKNCYYNGKVNVIKSDESGKKCFYQSLRRSESSRIQHLAVVYISLYKNIDIYASCIFI